MFRKLLALTVVYSILFSVQIALAETCNENSSFEISAVGDAEIMSKVTGLSGILNSPNSSIVLQSVDLFVEPFLVVTFDYLNPSPLTVTGFVTISGNAIFTEPSVTLPQAYSVTQEITVEPFSSGSFSIIDALKPVTVSLPPSSDYNANSFDIQLATENINFSISAGLEPFLKMANVEYFSIGDYAFGYTLLGDVNLDCIVNLLDVDPFIQALSTGNFQLEADVNQDGVVNLLDIDPFILLVSGG